MSLWEVNPASFGPALRVALARATSAWRNWAGSVLAVSVTAALMVHYVNVTFDDAFISFRYAENLAHGRGLVFNVGERVEGFSNFLWTVLLVPFIWLGLPHFEFGLLLAAKVLGAVFALATLVLLPRLARRVGGEPGALLVPILVAVQTPFALWAVGALETSLVTLLECVALTLHLQEVHARTRGGAGSASPPRPFAVPSSFVWVLAALTRPEPLVYFCICLVDRWWTLGPRTSRSKWGHLALQELHFLAWFVVPYVGFLAFRWGYYGEILPNTYYAKMHLSTRIWARGADYLSWGASVLGWWWVLGGALLGILLGGRFTAPVRLAFALFCAHLLVTAREGGDWMPALRFLVPALPLAALLVHAGYLGFRSIGVGTWPGGRDVPAWVVDPAWLDHARAWKERPRLGALLGSLRRAGAPALVIGAMAFGASSGRAVNLAWFPSGYGGLWLDCFAHFEVARHINRHLPRPALLAAGEAGVMPYYTRLRFLDLGALVDKHLAREPGAMHRKSDADYVLGRDPDYVVLQGVYDQEQHAFRSTTVYAASLLSDARFHERYRFDRSFADLGLFLRQPARRGAALRRSAPSR